MFFRELSKWQESTRSSKSFAVTSLEKKIIICMLAALCSVIIAGCGTGGTASGSSAVKETTAEVESTPVKENTEEADNESAEEKGEKGSDVAKAENNSPSSYPDELSDSEKAEMELASKFLDIDAYDWRQSYFDNNENRTDKDLSAMTVDGGTFKIGMTYDEVKSLGFLPIEDDFMDKKIGMVTTGDFINKSQAKVSVGFIASVADATIEDGGVLYCVKARQGKNTFSIDGITEESTIREVLDTFGEPSLIDFGAFSDFPDMQMRFDNEEHSQYLNMWVNLETEKIAVIKIEGYDD